MRKRKEEIEILYIDDEPLKKPKRSKIKMIIIAITLLLTINVSACSFLLYGPWPNFREWLITTSMTTKSHRYFATMFYSDDTINGVLNKNKVIEIDENTNPDLITVNAINFNVNSYSNKYEKEILTKDDKKNYKVIEISKTKFKGYLVAIYDPSKLEVASSKYLGTTGEYLLSMAKDNNAEVAINGGGFYEPKTGSNGGIPQGVVIEDGKVIYDASYGGYKGVIGITKENKLLLGKYNAKEAINKGIRDAVTFGPFLIVNGKSSFIKGNGGWGTAPRTVIGQRKDGIILLLVTNGRTLKYPGATMADVTEIMENYGAYNAANLDGGYSTALVVDDKLMDVSVGKVGNNTARPLATGFVLRR